MRRATVIAGNELRIMISEPTPIVLLIVLPAVAALFLSRGFIGGASAAVPGLSVMFGFVGATAVGAAFYRDHGWGTWERLRLSPASDAQLLAGKMLPLLALFGAQQLLVLSVGRLCCGMPWRGSVIAGALLVVGLIAVEASAGLVIAAFCRSISQVDAAGAVLGVTFAGLGGALGSVRTMPRYLQSLAHASPAFWGLRGLHAVISGGAGVGAVSTDVAVMWLAAIVLTGLAMWRLRFDESKTFYA
jgi:ABC-2 type transport system permease protein